MSVAFSLVTAAFLLAVASGTSSYDDARGGYMLVFHENNDLLLAANSNSCYFVSLSHLKMNNLYSASITETEDVVLMMLNGTKPAQTTLSSPDAIDSKFHDGVANIVCTDKQLYELTFPEPCEDTLQAVPCSSLTDICSTADAAKLCRKHCGLCSAPTAPALNCTFEQGLCGWSQGVADDLDWTTHQGSTPTKSTGPDTDHTLGTDQGQYVYMESTGTVPGEVAELQSPSFTSASPLCFGLWYYMYGANVDTLSVLLQDSMGIDTVLWTLSGDQGPGWYNATVTLTPSGSQSQVIIRASTGHSVLSDIAVDDVYVTSGACVKPDTDDCSPDPCLNGGTCNDGVNSYTCNCLPGYTGDQCQTDVNGCEPNRCIHGGTCTDDVASFTCICPAGFSGTICQIDINECDSSPCQHGGTCRDGIDSFTCTCPPGFTGTVCETDVDDCTSNTCLNGGTCSDGVNSYTCTCQPGYTGDQCQTDIDDCTPNPCLNGGTCQDGVSSYNCICLPGYIGNECQVASDSTHNCFSFRCPHDAVLESCVSGTYMCDDHEFCEVDAHAVHQSASHAPRFSLQCHPLDIRIQDCWSQQKANHHDCDPLSTSHSRDCRWCCLTEECLQELALGTIPQIPSVPIGR